MALESTKLINNIVVKIHLDIYSFSGLYIFYNLQFYVWFLQLKPLNQFPSVHALTDTHFLFFFASIQNKLTRIIGMTNLNL